MRTHPIRFAVFLVAVLLPVPVFAQGAESPRPSAVVDVEQGTVVGTVTIEGLVRTREQLVHDYLGIRPGEPFSAERLLRLQRRLDEFPAASGGTVRYDPVSGSATITPTVYERDRFPTSLMDWASVGIRVAMQQEIRVEASDVLGWGELWTPSYKFDRDWRRSMIRLEVPAPGRLPGVLRVEAFTEQQLFEGVSLGSLQNERRTRAEATLSDWATGWLRWEAGPAFDRINGTNYLNLHGQLSLRAFEDRAAVILTHGRWTSSADAFTRSEVALTARSSTRLDKPFVTGLMGVADTSGPAPLTVWPEAGSGRGQGIPLRAHRFDQRDLSGQEVFGRRMWFASAEYEFPVPTPIGPVGIAGFVDGVKAMSRLNSFDSPMHVDIGAGIRLAPSRSGSRARLDVAYGLRDGQIRISAGYMLPWGRR